MPTLALVDCNNFFVSCERSVDPSLENHPVVVLSNNDGCIISRSQEAKDLGIRMGAPYFKIKADLTRWKVRVLSSNFQLYSAKSAQVIHLFGQFTPMLEKYSIDEAFLLLKDIPAPLLRDYALELRQTVLQQVGIPVSIGLAETKTLAKLANIIAKKNARFGGVINLAQSPHWDMILSRTPVGEVWGVGYGLVRALNAHQILTAKALRDADDRWILKRFNTTLLRTVLELRGTPSFALRQGSSAKQSVMYSRSFGELITAQDQMEAAVSNFAARAGEKLREEGVAARHLAVYLRTSRHIDRDSRYSGYGETQLLAPTDCTQDLIRAALAVTRPIFGEGYGYYKAAIMLTDLVPAAEKQMSLFETRDLSRLDTLMHTLDQINHTFGSGTLQYASEGLHQPWLSRKEKLSPAGLAACRSGELALPQDVQAVHSTVGFVHPIHG